MAKALSILFVAAEAYPYAKETGVADVASSFPLAVRATGHDIRVMIPKYGCVSDRRNKIHDINRLKNIPISSTTNPDGTDPEEFLTTKSSSLSNYRHKVQVYVVTNNKFFESRKGIYTDPVKWTPYPDNLERFIFYSRSVVETCVALGWYPDIIHCNDWQTALIPAYIKHIYPNKFKKTKTVLTIHNVSNQGDFPISKFELLGLPEEVKECFTHQRKLNILKGGVLHSNHITTVSESYLEQIITDKNITSGLHTLLKQNFDSDKMTGIMNGIDVSVWNPKKDDCIPAQYDNNFREFKAGNKMALCDKCAIKYDENVPVIGMVTRLSEHKGVDVIIDAISELMKLDIQLIILGQGEVELKEKLLSLQQAYSEKLHVIFAFDDAFAHLVEAGSDMYLMPSRQEACGLNMFYSLSYGAVPIVNLTGGIKDAAIPYNSKTDPDITKSNCFAMKSPTASSLVAAVNNAIKIFKDKDKWIKIVKNGMDGDYSWGESVKKYLDIYKKIIKED